MTDEQTTERTVNLEALTVAMEQASQAYLRGDRPGAVRAWRHVTRTIPQVPRAWAGVLGYFDGATADDAAQGQYLLCGGVVGSALGSYDADDPDVWVWRDAGGVEIRGRLAWHQPETFAIDVMDATFLAMSLGYWYERRGDFASAAWMFGVRHQLTADMFEWPAAIFHETIDAVTRAAMASDAIGDDGETRLLLIVGAPRCGSTIIARALAAHPDVIEIGENSIFDDAIHAASREDGTVDVDKARGLATEALAKLTGIGAPRIIVNKQLNSWLWAPLIARMFPRVRFVDLRRDPVEQAISCWRTDFAMSTLSWATSWTGIAEYFRVADHAIENARALDPDLWRTVDYDAFAADPEPVLRDLLAWCGLPWDDAVLHPERRGHNVIDTASTFQAREPIRPPATWADCYPAQAAEFAALYPGGEP